MLAAFMVGSVVMSLEMLASRYLNPYFGGTIFTWSALISIVLLAMMGGYFLGGFSADKLRFSNVLEIMICLAAFYLLALPLFIDEFMELIVTKMENVRLGALVGALAITGPPVLFLSTFTPIAIRRTLSSLEYAGRIAGSIFAVSTAGNIFGTLLTSFYLIPNFGTRTLTASLSVILVIAAILVWLTRRRAGVTGGVTAAILAALLLLHPNLNSPLVAAPSTIAEGAAYPEGPVFIEGDLYYTEMTRDRVMKVEVGNPTVFFIKRDVVQHRSQGTSKQKS